MNFLPGLLLLSGTLALSAAPIDDQVKAFEDAVRADTGPPKRDAGLPAASDKMLLDGLDRATQPPENDQEIEALVGQLMAGHSSDKIQQLGLDLLHALQARGNEKKAAYRAKADPILARIPDELKRAKTAADLDGLLQDLKALQQAPTEAYVSDSASQLLSEKVNSAVDFVSWWQDYLSASAAGKTDEAHEALQRMLDDRRIEIPFFVPRSEILALRDGAPANSPGASAASTVSDALDAILGKVKHVEDVSGALNAIASIPNQPFDFSILFQLEHMRTDLGAGIPVTLNLELIANRTLFDDDISRIISLELLAMLPDYFGTNASDPPKPGETVTGYIDRLAASANSAGNLALLQRVLSVKAALVQDTGTAFRPAGAEQFLAGLSQDAGGQYAPAVVSYEYALKRPDPSLPVDIIGTRLAAIQSAHPDDFNRGLNMFMTSQRDNPLGLIGWPPGAPGQPPIRIDVLPIPMNLSIPAQPPAASTNAAPAGK